MGKKEMRRDSPKVLHRSRILLQHDAGFDVDHQARSGRFAAKETRMSVVCVDGSAEELTVGWKRGTHRKHRYDRSTSSTTSRSCMRGPLYSDTNPNFAPSSVCTRTGTCCTINAVAAFQSSARNVPYFRYTPRAAFTVFHAAHHRLVDCRDERVRNAKGRIGKGSEEKEYSPYARRCSRRKIAASLRASTFDRGTQCGVSKVLNASGGG